MALLWLESPVPCWSPNPVERSVFLFSSIPCGHGFPFLQRSHCMNSWILRSTVVASLSMKCLLHPFFVLNFKFYFFKWWTISNIRKSTENSVCILILLFSHPWPSFLVVLAILCPTPPLAPIMLTTKAFPCLPRDLQVCIHPPPATPLRCPTGCSATLTSLSPTKPRHFHYMCWWLSVLPNELEIQSHSGKVCDRISEACLNSIPSPTPQTQLSLRLLLSLADLL